MAFSEYLTLSDWLFAQPLLFRNFISRWSERKNIDLVNSLLGCKVQNQCNSRVPCKIGIFWEGQNIRSLTMFWHSLQNLWQSMQYWIIRESYYFFQRYVLWFVSQEVAHLMASYYYENTIHIQICWLWKGGLMFGVKNGTEYSILREYILVCIGGKLARARAS